MMETFGIILMLVLTTVEGYGSGPPPSKCDDMMPSHGVSVQTSDPPYRVQFPDGKTTYSESEQINVTLEGTDGSQFKGFMIQARSDADTYTTHGTIATPYPAGTGNACAGQGANKNAALSHTNKDPKDSVTFTWTAPSTDVGDIVFVFTVVEEKSKIWVKKTSSVLTYQQTDGTTNHINRDPDCEMTKSCFPSASDCSTNCDYLVTWRVSGTEDVEFTLRRKTTSNNYWIGIGFSDDPRMGNDSVVECVSNNGAVDVKVSFNPQYFNSRLNNDQFGVNLVNGLYSDGVLSCTFTRKINVSLTGETPETADQSKFFDLTKEWYLLVAHGNANAGTKTKHQQTPQIAPKKINFLTVDTATVTTQAVIDTGINRDPDCEMTKSCFPSASDCSTNCDYLVTWRVSGTEDVEFTLHRKTTSNNYWIGIGFSDDPRMGNDSVVECVSNNGAVDVKVSFNPQYFNSRLNNDQFGVNLVNGLYSDGVLSCTFTRKINVSLTGDTPETADQSKFFDLTKEWYLLVAHGNANAGTKTKHQQTPQIAPKKINFLTVDTATVTTQAVIDTGINRDPDCEMTKSCFPSASDCSTNCDYLVTWRVSGTEDVEFTLRRKTTSNNYWIGIGFSDDPRMGNDSVVECVSNNGAVDVKVSFNPQYFNSRLNNDQFGVNLVNGLYSDGVLSCTFTRKINVSLAGETPETADQSKFFDLTKEWYLLVAHGNANAGTKTKHQQTPQIAPKKINFLTVDTATVTTQAVIDTGVIEKETACGESLGCFHDCNSNGDSCGFLLTWVQNGDDIDFTLTCKRPGNRVYCAIGLSKDKKMGDDSVFECVYSDQVAVYVSYNDGRSNNRLSQETFGISNVVATHEDGILKCTFSRKKTAAQAEGNSSRKKRASEPSASTFFDMNDDFNLLYAYGTSVGGFINKHQVGPKVSSQKADFQSFMDIGAKSVAITLVKVHGVIMMVAWLFFVRLGIFIAGQYKTVWPEGMEWFGQKRWFILHRSIMVTAFLLTAVAFIIIFAHVGGYSKIMGSGFQKAHPILGIVTMCLATLNPIMALFRPHPGTPKRPYFNFAHISVGISAYVCAVVNIFSGFEQASVNAPFSAKIVVWVYLGWVAVIETVSYIYDCSNKKASKGETYEMKPAAVYEPDAPSQKVSKFKIGLLCLHAITMLALVIAACVIVWKGENKDDDHDD